MALISDKADAADRERRAAMPDPVRTARRGIVAGRYMGLTERHAAMMVMACASAAEASAKQDGAFDVTWLTQIHAEAERIYLQTLPGTP